MVVYRTKAMSGGKIFMETMWSSLSRTTKLGAAWTSENPWHFVLLVIVCANLYFALDYFLTYIVVTRWGLYEFLVFDGMHRFVIGPIDISQIPSDARSGLAAFFAGYILPLTTKEKLVERPILTAVLWILSGLMLILSAFSTAYYDPSITNSAIEPDDILGKLHACNQLAFNFSIILIGSLTGRQLIGNKK